MQYAQPLIWEARVLTRSSRDGSRPHSARYLSRPRMAFIAPGATFVYSIRGCIVNLLSLPMGYSKEKRLPEIFLANRPAHALSSPLTPTREPRCLRNSDFCHSTSSCDNSVPASAT